MIPTREAIERRILKEAFKTRLLDNSMRGFWCEFMVAEALGPDCHTVGLGWHPWDLQIGDSRDTFPDRIRIQVKTAPLCKHGTPDTAPSPIAASTSP